MKPRLVMKIAATSLIVVACAGAGDARPAASFEVTALSVAWPDGPSALRDPNNSALPPPLVPLNELYAGGPPPDGIPALDQPVFVDVADHLDRYRFNAPVVVLEIDGDVRAYPVAVLIWHEIVNDTVGGVPVAVTYCPLCNSAVAYGRVIDGRETTFGTSGWLHGSALVMYDRATESLWTHFDGRSVVGVLAGTELELYPSPLMSWDEFRVNYPDGLVLDETRTGHTRAYGRNPYFEYDDPDTHPFLFFGDIDTRARAKERVVGVSIDGEHVAYSLTSLAGDGPQVTSATQGGLDIVVLWAPGQASALHGPSVQYGRDVGTVGAFVPEVGGRTLTLSREGERIVDAETSSSWSAAGIAQSGPLAGEQLERIPHLDTFWFAWSTYRPGSALVGSVGSDSLD